MFKSSRQGSPSEDIESGGPKIVDALDY